MTLNRELHVVLLAKHHFPKEKIFLLLPRQSGKLAKTSFLPSVFLPTCATDRQEINLVSDAKAVVDNLFLREQGKWRARVQFG